MGWLTWADGSTRVGGSTSEVGSTRVGGSTLQDTAGSGGRGPQGPPQLPWKLGNNNDNQVVDGVLGCNFKKTYFSNIFDIWFTFPCEWYFRSGTQLVLYGQWGHWNLMFVIIINLFYFS